MPAAWQFAPGHTSFCPIFDELRVELLVNRLQFEWWHYWLCLWLSIRAVAWTASPLVAFDKAFSVVRDYPVDIFAICCDFRLGACVVHAFCLFIVQLGLYTYACLAHHQRLVSVTMVDGGPKPCTVWLVLKKREYATSVWCKRVRRNIYLLLPRLKLWLWLIHLFDQIVWPWCFH